MVYDHFWSRFGYLLAFRVMPVFGIIHWFYWEAGRGPHDLVPASSETVSSMRMYGQGLWVAGDQSRRANIRRPTKRDRVDIANNNTIPTQTKCLLCNQDGRAICLGII